MLPGPEEISPAGMLIVRVIVVTIWIFLSVGFISIFRVRKR